MEATRNGCRDRNGELGTTSEEIEDWKKEASGDMILNLI